MASAPSNLRVPAVGINADIVARLLAAPIVASVTQSATAALPSRPTGLQLYGEVKSFLTERRVTQLAFCVALGISPSRLVEVRAASYPRASTVDQLRAAMRDWPNVAKPVSADRMRPSRLDAPNSAKPSAAASSQAIAKSALSVRTAAKGPAPAIVRPAASKSQTAKPPNASPTPPRKPAPIGWAERAIATSEAAIAFLRSHGFSVSRALSMASVPTGDFYVSSYTGQFSRAQLVELAKHKGFVE